MKTKKLMYVAILSFLSLTINYISKISATQQYVNYYVEQKGYIGKFLVNLYGFDNYSILYNFGDGNNLTTNETEIFYVYNQVGIYETYVNITDLNTNKTYKLSHEISISPFSSIHLDIGLQIGDKVIYQFNKNGSIYYIRIIPSQWYSFIYDKYNLKIMQSKVQIWDKKNLVWAESDLDALFGVKNSELLNTSVAIGSKIMLMAPDTLMLFFAKNFSLDDIVFLIKSNVYMIGENIDIINVDYNHTIKINLEESTYYMKMHYDDKNVVDFYMVYKKIGSSESIHTLTQIKPSDLPNYFMPSINFTYTINGKSATFYPSIETASPFKKIYIDFGDHSNLTLTSIQPIVHNYKHDGNFNVTISVTDDNEVTAYFSQIIRINNEKYIYISIASIIGIAFVILLNKFKLIYSKFKVTKL